MTQPELYFQNIHVRRMPGFPDKGFFVDDLCPGINIIYGPNASGKTTLSRAIWKLLRPQDPPHRSRSLAASLQLDREQLTIDYDMGHTSCQRNGLDQESPSLAPADTGNRYVLALHDLLRSENASDLATEIVKESTGGYDLGAAREALGFKDRPSGRGKPYDQLESAVKDTRRAYQRQDELLEAERELKELRRRKEEAQQAANQLEWLKKAVQYHEARETYHRAAGGLETFPEQVAQLTGREVEDLDRLQELLEEAQRKSVQIRQKRDTAQQQMAETRLPPSGVPPALVGTLRLKCQKVRQLCDQLEAKKAERAEAATKLDRSRQALGNEIDENKVARWDAAMIRELAGFARRAEKVRSEKAAVERLTEWLRSTPDNQPAGGAPDRINEALRLLYRWLAVQRDEPKRFRLKHVLLAAGSVTAVLSVGMGTLVHASWFSLLLVAVGLAVWAYWPRQCRDRRAEIERDFAMLGLEQPSPWSEVQVRDTIQDLQRHGAAAELDREKTIRCREVDARSKKIAEQFRKFEQEKENWSQHLGVPLDQEGSDEAWFFYLVQHGVDCQKAETDVAVADKGVRNTEEQLCDPLREINETLAKYGYSRTEDPEEASGFVEDLDQRVQVHENARRTVATDEETLQGIERDIQHWRDELATLFQRVGLDVEQESTLRQWASMYPEYQQAAENRRHAKADLEATKTALGGHVELADRPKQELLDAQRRSEDQAHALEELNRKIGGIEEQLSNAKQGCDLEEALAREAERAESLRRQRDMDYDLVAGHTLVEFLGRQQRDRERPAVFQKAQELFVEITHGQFRLDIDESDPPGFRAFDTQQRRGLALEELSSGTRLQLVLAVKLAFIERQESGPKFPLILDETLANSDERRAREIIEAATEICRAGRQVFYLTAQYDEVQKWRRMLSGHEVVPTKLVNLAEVRELEYDDAGLPAVEPPHATPEIPRPDGFTWWQYGRHLPVPAHHPAAELGRIHLWYLIDDLDSLHRLLTQGITCWGQLKTLVEYGRCHWVESTSPLCRRAEARVRVVESIARYWRIGRGRPVDRQVLMESGAVSDTFIDRVTQLADRVDGDATALLEGLDRGEVKGFRGDKRNELAQYLSENGYLDQRETMTADQIREQVRSCVFADLEQGLLTPEQFEHLFAAVVPRSEQGLGE